MSISLIHKQYQLTHNHMRETKSSHLQPIGHLQAAFFFCLLCSQTHVKFYSNLQLPGQITQFQFCLHLSSCTATFYIFCLSATLSQFRLMGFMSRKPKKIGFLSRVSGVLHGASCPPWVHDSNTIT